MGDKGAVISLVRGASVELTARDGKAIERSGEMLERGTPVFISRVPGDTNEVTVGAARRLRQLGVEPVPHIGARYFASREALEDLLARLRGEAAVEEVLCIAGDLSQPLGPLASSAEIIETGLLEKNGIRKVNIAGYPEGHPKIAAPVLADFMQRKLARLAQSGLAPTIVMQFCFESEPIVAFVKSLRTRGVAVPVRVGLAGPASMTTLAKYAIRCGVGNSARALLSGGGRFARLLTDAGPEAIVAELAAAKLDLAGLHFYTFGGLAKTAAWLNTVRSGNFSLTGDEAGFKLNR